MSNSRLEAARAALASAEQAAGANAAGAEHRAPDGDGSTRADAEPDPHEVARKIVLRQLTMAPRTRQQLADKLRQRGCAEEVAETVLDRMTEVGLVDDAAFARMFVRSRQETKGLAAPAISQELRRKGVSEEHIEDALRDVDPEVEKDTARQLVDKRLRSMHGLDRKVQARRLAGFLARKGYRPGVSYEVIRDAFEEAPEHQRD